VPVGNYNITTQKDCQGLWHGRLNRVFELAGVLCQSCLEFMVQKQKHAGALPTLTQKGASGKRRRPRVSSHFGTQTSTLELNLAKPVRPSKKFVAQASGLSITEKSSSVGITVSRKKAPSTSVGASDVV
jgi:hypothetical protein